MSFTHESLIDFNAVISKGRAIAYTDRLPGMHLHPGGDWQLWIKVLQQDISAGI